MFRSYLLKVVFILFILFPIIFSFPVEGIGDVSVWPARINVDIKEYSEEKIQHSIEVYNKNSFPVKVSAKVRTPDMDNRVEGYSDIPDLSWIKVESESFVVGAKESKTFNVTIDIPKDERSRFYNESWEVWVTTYAGKNKNEDGVNLQTAVSTRFLISTPENPDRSFFFGGNTLVLVGFSSGILALIAMLIYIKKKKIHK
ncbi:MAG: hypothetical protein V5A64_03000 [Candidatus Thermoplasmatota archaeon]